MPKDRAEVSGAVMELVQRELTANPEVSWKDLKHRATELDASIADLSDAQFNARYPLQVKRSWPSVQEKEVAGRQRGVAKRAARIRQKAEEAPEAPPAAEAPSVPTTEHQTRHRRNAAPPAASRGRDEARRQILSFARDVSLAEDKAGWFEVVGGIDDVLDRIERAYEVAR